MLTAGEEQQLMKRLPFKGAGEAGRLAENLYTISLKKYSRPEELELPERLERLDLLERLDRDGRLERFERLELLELRERFEMLDG